MTNKAILIRHIQAFLFVVVYMAIWIVLKPLKLNANIYLFIGIPLTLIFQIFIRKQPIQTLWVREYSKFKLSKWGMLIAAAFIILPVKIIIQMILHNKIDVITILYMVIVILGTIGLAYSISHFTKSTMRFLFLCIVTAGILGIGFFIATTIAQSINLHKTIQPNFKAGIKSLLIYFPACFIIEEVVFRGLLDSHVYHPGQKKGIWSAIFISALWGLWHIPVAPVNGIGNLLIQTAVLIGVHTVIGVPLSIFWRKSGNIVVTCFTHSFIDAVRNTLLSYISV
ncbi:MAG: CPBP family intramembrane glutamic endopeptidase [Bacteroidia bacterium]